MMTVTDLAAVTGLGWDTVKNILKARLEKDYGHLRLRGLERLSIDEIYFGRHKKFYTLVIDLLLMRRENVEEEKLPRLDDALKHNEPLFTAYLLKEALDLLWEQPTYGQMRSLLSEWCAWADESAIAQMRQMARTLLSHKNGILSWWKHRINNGRMEGINNKIKTLLRQTYGLRVERYLVLRLLGLHDSRLELLG